MKFNQFWSRYKISAFIAINKIEIWWQRKYKFRNVREMKNQNENSQNQNDQIWKTAWNFQTVDKIHTVYDFDRCSRVDNERIFTFIQFVSNVKTSLRFYQSNQKNLNWNAISWIVQKIKKSKSEQMIKCMKKKRT